MKIRSNKPGWRFSPGSFPTSHSQAITALAQTVRLRQPWILCRLTCHPLPRLSPDFNLQPSTCNLLPSPHLDVLNICAILAQYKILCHCEGDVFRPKQSSTKLKIASLRQAQDAASGRASSSQ